MKKIKTRVVIIGGGATGTGVFRDLAARGIDCVLVEKRDIAHGTTGRNHGLLHSGARYAVTDINSAKECAEENKILKRIAGHCIENTGGLFAALPEDDPEYLRIFLESCTKAGIDAEHITVPEALRREPGLNPQVKTVVAVPDATIDPFRLASANMLDALEQGGRIMTHTSVSSILKDPDGISGVTCIDQQGQEYLVETGIIVNAAGIWAGEICRMAGIELNMFPSKGSMLIIDYRVNRMVVNRLRKPSDADIVVPGDTVSLIGTTSQKIGYPEIDTCTVTDNEVDLLMEEGEKLIPAIRNARALRAYCGVRPLIAPKGETKGRNITRGIVLIDHEDTDNTRGLVTVTGGKLMTYRLMAQKTADLVCTKLNIKAACSTHTRPLPGSESPVRSKKIKQFTGISRSVIGSTFYRHGSRVFSFLKKDKKNYRVICECEMVTEGEIAYAIEKLGVKDLVDLRRRTRVGMGPCQGELCSYRSSGLMCRYGHTKPEEVPGLLEDFMEERWKGMKPVMWGDGIRAAELSYWVYRNMLCLDSTKGK